MNSVSGRKVADMVEGRGGEGERVARWTVPDARDGSLQPGVYFVRVRAAGLETRSRMLIVQ